MTESALRAGDGRLNVDGEIEFDRAADLRVRLDKVDFAPFLPPDWRLRLHGKLAGTAQVHAPLPEGALQMSGDLQLVDGMLEALPLFDQIATFTRTERFRRIALTRGSLNFSNESDRTVVKNLVLESEGLMRVEGDCTIAQKEDRRRFPDRRDRGQPAMAAGFAIACLHRRARRLLLDAGAGKRPGRTSA